MSPGRTGVSHPRLEPTTTTRAVPDHPSTAAGTGARMRSDPSVDPVVPAQRLLLDPAVRLDRARLAELLADGFREIGASGRLVDRASIMDVLTTERRDPVPRDLDEMGTTLADDLVLLTCRLPGPDGVSRRSSLWRLTADGPRLEFHQGTPAPGDA